MSTSSYEQPPTSPTSPSLYDSDASVELFSYAKKMHQHTKNQMEAAARSARRRSANGEGTNAHGTLDHGESVSSMDTYATHKYYGLPICYEDDAPRPNPLTPTATPTMSTFDVADPIKYPAAPLPPKRKRGGRPGIGADALNLLRDLPEVRPMPCGVGRFALCVTLDGWFFGACATCQMGSRGNTCSLRMAAEGRLDDSTKQDDFEDVSDYSSAPPEHMVKAERALQRREDMSPAGETMDLSHLRSPSPDKISPLSYSKRKLDSMSATVSPEQNPISSRSPIKRARETYSEPRQQAAEPPANRWNSVPPTSRTPLPSQPQYIPRHEEDEPKRYSPPKNQPSIYKPVQRISPSPSTYPERRTQVQHALVGPTHPSQSPYIQPTYSVGPSQSHSQSTPPPHSHLKTISKPSSNTPRHNAPTTTIAARPQTHNQCHPHSNSHSQAANHIILQSPTFTTTADPRSISTSTATATITATTTSTTTVPSSPRNSRARDNRPLIDTLNRKQRNAVYGMIGGMQSGIRIVRQQADELQRQLVMLQEVLGVE
ncbi:hypothetical protein B7494_g7961 [Chlorociboria aeruginascens]|nr:hypothetical protein B7494_g7961 [Chlorociboria aeruginascens]